MDLPVLPPIAPMLAKPSRTIPPDMHYEAKWDGFRAIIFRDGDEVEIGSRNEKPLTRYFPEVVELAKRTLPQRCVVDGEIIIESQGHLDFDALLNRIHPAASRVAMLAEQTPASFVAFDLLALGDNSLMSDQFSLRRAQLVEAVQSGQGMHVAPATTDQALATEWFELFEGAGLDGLIAKALTAPYEPNKRSMIKIKHERTADCVVAGYRQHKSGEGVGSLLLGLYDAAGRLHQVGVSASFTMAKRRELVELLRPYELSGEDANTHPWIAATAAADTDTDVGGVGVRMPGGQTRWNSGKDLSWQPLRPELVVEVAYDHMQGDRFRHTAGFRRWRPDRDPESCDFAQLDRPTTVSLSTIWQV